MEKLLEAARGDSATRSRAINDLANPPARNCWTLRIVFDEIFALQLSFHGSANDCLQREKQKARSWKMT